MLKAIGHFALVFIMCFLAITAFFIAFGLFVKKKFKDISTTLEEQLGVDFSNFGKDANVIEECEEK